MAISLSKPIPWISDFWVERNSNSRTVLVVMVRFIWMAFQALPLKLRPLPFSIIEELPWSCDSPKDSTLKVLKLILIQPALLVGGGGGGGTMVTLRPKLSMQNEVTASRAKRPPSAKILASLSNKEKKPLPKLQHSPSPRESSTRNV